MIGSAAESASAPTTLAAPRSDIAPKKSRREQEQGLRTVCFYYSGVQLQTVLSSFTGLASFDEIES